MIEQAMAADNLMARHARKLCWPFEIGSVGAAVAAGFDCDQHP